MAQFYGSIQGSRGAVTRLGGKDSGMQAIAAGWGGAINTSVWHDKATGKDMFRVELTPWSSSGGDGCVLAEGELDARASSLDDLHAERDYKGRPYTVVRRAMA